MSNYSIVQLASETGAVAAAPSVIPAPPPSRNRYATDFAYGGARWDPIPEGERPKAHYRKEFQPRKQLATVQYPRDIVAGNSTATGPPPPHSRSILPGAPG